MVEFRSSRQFFAHVQVWFSKIQGFIKLSSIAQTFGIEYFCNDSFDDEGNGKTK